MHFVDFFQRSLRRLETWVDIVSISFSSSNLFCFMYFLLRKRNLKGCLSNSKKSLTLMVSSLLSCLFVFTLENLSIEIFYEFELFKKKPLHWCIGLLVNSELQCILQFVDFTKYFSSEMIVNLGFFFHFVFIPRNDDACASKPSSIKDSRASVFFVGLWWPSLLSLIWFRQKRGTLTESLLH